MMRLFSPGSILRHLKTANKLKLATGGNDIQACPGISFKNQSYILRHFLEQVTPVMTASNFWIMDPGGFFPLRDFCSGMNRHGKVGSPTLRPSVQISGSHGNNG